MGGCGGDLVGVADLDDLAAVEDGDAVADCVHHAEVVADEEVGDAGVLLQLREKRENPCLGGDVERAGRFVADDDRGVQARARAMATRWRWPPENSRG